MSAAGNLSAQPATTAGYPASSYAQPSAGIALLGTQPYRDAQITVQGAGTATAPTAGTVIATCTPGQAGLWAVVVTAGITGTSAVNKESNNMALNQTSTARLSPIVMSATTTGVAPAVVTQPVILNLTAADTVNVTAIADGTATTPIYAADIVCTRVG